MLSFFRVSNGRISLTLCLSLFIVNLPPYQLQQLSLWWPGATADCRGKASFCSWRPSKTFFKDLLPWVEWQAPHYQIKRPNSPEFSFSSSITLNSYYNPNVFLYLWLPMAFKMFLPWAQVPIDKSLLKVFLSTKATCLIQLSFLCQTR